MIETVLNLIAPDYCYSCGKVGTLLCSSCVYNIISEPFGRCLLCLTPTSDNHLCSGCASPVSCAWVVGERDSVLRRLVDDSKFSSNRRACYMQASLLHQILPQLPPDTIVTPIPTIWPHQRERGLGHAELVARSLARQRELTYTPLLSRANNSVQHGASRRKRLKQSKQAYKCDRKLDAATPILVVDDVCTTGASLLAAARVLQSAGARRVWVAVTTRQVLDD